MSRLVRYWATLLGMAGAALYWYRHYERRWVMLEKQLPFVLEHPVSARKRWRAYLRIFLLIEYWYSVLSGAPLRPEQRARSGFLALLTPLYDDLIDESGDTGVDLDLLPETHPCRMVFDAAGFSRDAHWRRIEQAQMNSRMQRQSGLPLETLERLCAEKGAASVCLGLHVIGEGAGGAAMEQAAARLGFFVQLLNDAFDVWKDREAGIHTLFTDSPDMEQAYNLYRHTFDQLLLDIDQIAGNTMDKEKVKGLLVILYCLGKVAIEQLCALNSASGGVFRVEAHGRSALVCDMERWRNRWKWGLEVLQFMPAAG